MQTTSSQSIESTYGWMLAVLSLAMVSVVFVAATSIPLLLKPMGADLGVSTTSLAQVHMSMMFGAAFGGLLFGHLHDRIGFFPLGVIGAMAVSGGLVGMAMAEETWVLYICVGLLIGVMGQGVFFSPTAAALSQWFDRHRALAIAMVASGQGVGGLLLAPALRWAAYHWGWREALLGFGVIGGLLLLACAFAFRRKIPVARAPRSSAAAATSPAAVLYQPSRACMIILSGSLALSCFATFLVIGHVTAAAEERGATQMFATMMVSSMMGASLVTRLGGAAASRRIGNYRTLVFATALHLAGSTLLALPGSNYILSMSMGVILMGLGFGAYLPGYAVLVREFFPAHEAGRRIGEINFFAFIASGLGSWVGGWLRDSSGSYHMAFIVCAASNVVAVVALASQWKSLKKY